MKILVAPIVIGMLVGVLPATAQSKPLSDKGTSVGVATPHDSAAERNSYNQQAQGEVKIWQTRLNDFNAKLGTKATAAEANASKDLDSAWTKTKTAANQLETAGEKDWGSAKASFQTATNKLTVAWQKVSSKDK
jgi:hypothetical protein